MFARVTTFEGGTADGIRSAMKQLQAQIPAGPPPGVKAKGLTVLADPDSGSVIWVGVFESEEDLRASEAVLSQMPAPEGLGSRSAPKVYEVATDTRL
jgi:hypothetical protein